MKRGWINTFSSPLLVLSPSISIVSRRTRAWLPGGGETPWARCRQAHALFIHALGPRGKLEFPHNTECYAGSDLKAPPTPHAICKFEVGSWSAFTRSLKYNLNSLQGRLLVSCSFTRDFSNWCLFVFKRAVDYFEGLGSLKDVEVQNKAKSYPSPQQFA